MKRFLRDPAEVKFSLISVLHMDLEKCFRCVALKAVIDDSWHMINGSVNNVSK